MRKIILADNQDITKAGCQFLFTRDFQIEDFREATDKSELLTLLSLHPDSLVILDYTIFDFQSVSELIILNERFKKLDWILFSEELSDEFLHTLLYNTQSFSVLMKSCGYDEISLAFKESLKGNRFICNYVSNLLLDNSKNIQNSTIKQLLTVTEKEILKEMALGKTTKEIAVIRFVSAHTIMTHRKNIFRKIDVNNVHEATKYAIRAGIVDMAEYYI